MLYSTQYSSPIGSLELASDGDQLIGLWLEGQKYYGSGISEEKREQAGLPVFQAARIWLDEYFSGQRPENTLPLAPRGSVFRQQVWDILRTLPYGTVITYGEIAHRLAGQNGTRVSAQAVGGAVGHNPLSILIPCHRVIGADGSLTGYAGGIEKKHWLLQHEGADVSKFSLPKRGTAL